MTATSGTAPLAVTVTPQGFRELMLAVKGFDKKLATQVRSGIRTAGKVVMGKAATEIRSGSYGTNVGLRDGIASGLRLQISTAARYPGVRIVATGAGLPANKKHMSNTFEADTFKHKVFGDPEVWVEQKGHRAFYPTIYDNRGIVTKAIETGMQVAATGLGREVHA